MPKKSRQGNLKHIFIAARRWFWLSCAVSNARIFLFYWLPALVWMAVIFTASADPRSAAHSSTLFMPLLHFFFPQIPTDEAERLHHYFRKCCHLSEYAILALLVRRALIHGVRSNWAPCSWQLTGSVIGIVFLYAASDEFHQIFVPTRTPLFSDVCIDTTGGAAGLLVAGLCRHLWRRIGQTP